MSYTNGLDKPTDYFNTKLYTGNGSTGHAITGVGFQPDWVWIKSRDSGSDNHNAFDVVRGASKGLQPNDTDAEYTASSVHESFDTDGFTLGDNGQVNGSSESFVSWNWLASNTTASNSNGSITSTVSANTTSGFSIVKYTGTGSQATVGHGLGVAPSVLIHKKLTTSADAWSVYHKSIGVTKRLILSSTEAATADASPQPDWNDVAPTNSLFTVGTSSRTNATEDYICYAFAEKQGYSKFGSYTGNGNADGTFVYTGFKPAFMMVKRTDNTSSWIITDSTRDPINAVDNYLSANNTNAESDFDHADFLSNGIKFTTTNDGWNVSGGSYIYMCFAESPFTTSTGIPTTAR